MRPVLEIFGVSVNSFGVMMALGFLAAAAILRRRLAEEGYDPALWGVGLVATLSGGVLGAKLYYAVDTALRTGRDVLPLLLPLGGMTWYGGLAGGFLGAAVATRLVRMPLKAFADCVCIGIAVGQAIGRVGCLLAGDDYGRPTDLPWGIAFPQGAPPTVVPVHPTQIYDMVWLLLVAAFLWHRRRRSPFLCGEYLALHGLGRIAIEHFRVNPALALGWSQAQWLGLALVVYGAGAWLFYRRRAGRAAAAVSGPRA